jgi:ribose transport system substrate-binding protein
MKKTLALAAVAVAALGLAACTPATSAPDAASEDDGVSSCSAEVVDAVDAARAPSELVLPTDPVDVKSLKGSSFYYVGSSMNEFTLSVLEGVQAGAEAAGIDLTVWDGQGTVNRMAEGIETAIAQGADAIATNGVDPALVPEAFAAAQDAGIPIIATFAGDANSDQPATVYSNISSDFVSDGDLISKWAMVDSGCATDLLMVYAPTIAVWDSERAGSEAAFANDCPECAWDSIAVDAANIATDTPSQLQTALQRNPDIEYVFMAWDSGVPLISSIVASNPGVQVLGRDGIEASLADIAAGGSQTLTLAMPPGSWIGYATIDDMFRAASGLEPSGIVIPGRLVDAENVGDGSIADVSPNYVGFEESFLELWSLS